ncbi:uncharacterized protein [Haliotis asinina]|uniref:uncharacterized protein n=1 Tax=Haliotis asinina TaxID=109174 RepID=UPI003531A5B7
MICLLVLTFAYGALSAPVAPPDLTTGLTQSFHRIDHDGSGKADVSEFLRVFDLYDHNHDGKMTKEEYIASSHAPKYVADAIFKNYHGGLLRTDVKNVLTVFDANGDGAVSLSEFVSKYKSILSSVQNHPVGK